VANNLDKLDLSQEGAPVYYDQHVLVESDP